MTLVARCDHNKGDKQTNRLGWGFLRAPLFETRLVYVIAQQRNTSSQRGLDSFKKEIKKT